MGVAMKLEPINRRQFLLTWIFQPQPGTVQQVEVIEVFSAGQGPSAFLVHHVNESVRVRFAEWLHRADGAQISFQLPNGPKIDGRIFRVRMCFGRGLVLTRGPVAVRPKDRVTFYREGAG